MLVIGGNYPSGAGDCKIAFRFQGLAKLVDTDEESIGQRLPSEPCCPALETKVTNLSEASLFQTGENLFLRRRAPRIGEVTDRLTCGNHIRVHE